MSENLTAIVDPYSSGALLAAEFGRWGCPIISVRSTPAVPPLYHSSRTFDGFLATVQHTGDVEQTARELRRRGVRHVLAGCELGVELADQLVQCLGLEGNTAEQAAARRDKGLMTQAVARRGLRTAATFRALQCDEMLAWTRRLEAWPLVAKPPTSTGSDAVRLCASEEELRQAFNEIIEQPNKLGRTNDAVLVQEFLPGTEYVVDTVSCRGQHFVAAVWRYEAPAADGPAIGYRSMELLSAEGDPQNELVAYTFEALDALGIRQGAAHTELKWVDGHAVLVEVGARANGGHNPLVSHLCGGVGQIELTVESYLAPDRFLERLGQPYRLTKRGVIAFLTPHAQQRFRRAEALAGLGRLHSCRDLHVSSRENRPPGGVAGWILLVHEDPDVVQGDIERIRAWEMHGCLEEQHGVNCS